MVSGSFAAVPPHSTAMPGVGVWYKLSGRGFLWDGGSFSKSLWHFSTQKWSKMSKSYQNDLFRSKKWPKLTKMTKIDQKCRFSIQKWPNLTKRAFLTQKWSKMSKTNQKWPFSIWKMTNHNIFIVPTHSRRDRHLPKFFIDAIFFWGRYFVCVLLDQSLLRRWGTAEPPVRRGRAVEGPAGKNFCKKTSR